MSSCSHEPHDHHGHSHNHGHAHDHKHDHGHGQAHTPSADTAGAEQVVFHIQKMDCPTEEALIRKQMQGVDGIVDMQFNLITRELTIWHRLQSVGQVMQRLQSIDMAPRVRRDSLDDSVHDDHAEDAPSVPRYKWIMTGFAGIAALASEVLAWTTGSDSTLPVIALALAAIALGGTDTLRKGWIALRHRSLNMNFLMTIAVIGAIIIGQWPEAAMVIVLFTLAEMIEALSLDRARNAIRDLMQLSPDTATVATPEAPDNWHSMAAGQVTAGMLMRIRPGEHIPLDGEVTQGNTTINQAAITGESLPVERGPGDPVFAGTINEHGTITCRVTASQQESTLSRIVRSVQQAQGERAPTQRFVDQFARYYIPCVVVLALLVAAIPPLLLGAPAMVWLYKALVLLVIACPCALVISTPVTIVSGLASAARAGILVKGGVYLEQARKLDLLALDKTGTITAGKPVVTDVMALDGDTHTLLHHAASIAAGSDHPVSAAIAMHWQEQDNPPPMLATQAAQALPGRGVQATIDGTTWSLGNHRMTHEYGHCSPALEAQLEALEKQGKTTTILCRGPVPVLVIAVADTVRPTSKAAIATLRAAGVHVVMLSGDNQHTAAHIGAEVGIDEARGNQLPQDKLEAMAAYGQRYRMTGMVGDGINDAPALAKAGIGFAMGAAGTDVALDTADVALMDDDLGKLPVFLRLSHRTHRILMQNISLALGIKAVFLVLALMGEATLWMAVFADLGASLLVVFNGMRLLRRQH